jgi:hypothetical protein
MRAVLPSDKTNSARTMNYKSLALGSRALSLSRVPPNTLTRTQPLKNGKLFMDHFLPARTLSSYDFSSPAHHVEPLLNMLLIYGPKQQ